MSDSKSSASGGIGLCGVFIVGVVLALLSARFLFGSFADIADARKRRRRLKDMYDND